MVQSVWHYTDLARIGQTLIDVAPTLDFAAGVAALCKAVGAVVYLPERSESAPVVVTIDGAPGREVTP